MTAVAPLHRFGNTGIAIPRVVFGTSCLGNLYRVVPAETKRAIVAEIFRHSGRPVMLDSAGKYGAGLALESMGEALRALRVAPDDVLISNKLGWYRIPLMADAPQFEPGVWAGIRHDAEARISYEGILECEQQGRELLGNEYPPSFVSLHDPDEYLAAARTPAEATRRFENILDAYRALFALKASGRVRAVGVGAKDWRVIRQIAEQVEIDWVMLACSLTVYTHPPELLNFIADLRLRGVGIINSAVFNAGFLTGGSWFDYRRADPVSDAGLFRWREGFFTVCRRFNVLPADVCVQFSLAVPGIAAVALNTEKPERIAANIRSAFAEIPSALWLALKDERLIDRNFPLPGAT